MKRILLIGGMLLAPTMSFADRLGSLRNNAQVSLSSQAVQVSPSYIQDGFYAIFGGTVTGGGFYVYGPIIVDTPTVSPGFFAARSSLSFDPRSGSSSLNLRSYDGASTSGGISWFNSNGDPVVKWSVPPQLSGVFSIQKSTDATEGPKNRLQIHPRGTHRFMDATGTTFVEFEPLANSSFTVPVVVPTEAYDDNGWDGDLSVPTKDAVRDKIETISVGGGGSSSLAVGTGTAASFSVYTTSPTAAINFNSVQFTDVLTGGATSFISLNQSSVTLQGKFEAGSNITLTPSGGVTTIAATGGGTTFTISSYTTPGFFTYTVPTTAKTLDIWICGAGGSGGGGQGEIAGNARGGGSAGGGGACSFITLSTAAIGGSLGIAIGDGPTGPTAVTGAAGTAGADGGTTSIWIVGGSTLAVMYGGRRGVGGTADAAGGAGGGWRGVGAAATGGLPGVTANLHGMGGAGGGTAVNQAGRTSDYGGSGGGSGDMTAAGQNGGTSTGGGAGGGGGAGITAASPGVAANGGAGGRSGDTVANSGGGGTAGTGGAACTDGGIGSPGIFGLGGSGGGGGGSDNNSAACAGGAGGYCGGGGGGGGGGTNTGGAGGSGGDGCVIIIPGN